MTGTYSSVQQAQQEREAPGEAARPHAHLDIEVTSRDDGHLDVRIVQNRQRVVGHEVWIQHAGHLFRPLDSLFSHVEVTEDGLAATIPTGPLANPLPSRLLRT